MSHSDCAAGQGAVRFSGRVAATHHIKAPKLPLPSMRQVAIKLEQSKSHEAVGLGRIP